MDKRVHSLPQPRLPSVAALEAIQRIHLTIPVEDKKQRTLSCLDVS
jgi:hypothetical protein